MASGDHNQPHCTACGQNSVTEFRLGRIDETLTQIGQTLDRFARLEERHVASDAAMARAFAELKEQDDRLTAIEQEMPTLKLARGWMIALMTGSCGLLVSILAVLVFGSPL